VGRQDPLPVERWAVCSFVGPFATVSDGALRLRRLARRWRCWHLVAFVGSEGTILTEMRSLLAILQTEAIKPSRDKYSQPPLRTKILTLRTKILNVPLQAPLVPLDHARHGSGQIPKRERCEAHRAHDEGNAGGNV
jgi:hypothetical protein